MYHLARVAMFVLFAGIIAGISVTTAGGQYRPRELRSIRFQASSRTPGKIFSYAMGDLETHFYKGICSIQADFTAREYGYTFATHRKMETGDVVGMLGGVFRARCDSTQAVLERIADKDLPEGVRAPAWDSITVPLKGGSGFNNPMSVDALEINATAEKAISASLRVTRRPLKKPRETDVVHYLATVKVGDILLVGSKGHVVRGIVPPDNKARVVGWVELSPQPIPEADLIRDKKAFVRPQLEKKADK